MTRSSYHKAQNIAKLFDEKVVVLEDSFFCFKKDESLSKINEMGQRMNDYIRNNPTIKNLYSPSPEFDKLRTISAEEEKKLMAESLSHKAEIINLKNRFRKATNINFFPFQSSLDLVLLDMNIPGTVANSSYVFFVWQNTLFFRLGRLKKREIDKIIQRLNRLPKVI